MARKKITASLPPTEQHHPVFDDLHPDEGDPVPVDAGEDEQQQDAPLLPPSGVNSQPLLLPSQSEAIRQALGELGRDAPVNRVQDWIKSHYSMDVAPSNVYQAKNKLGGHKAATKPPTHTSGPFGDPMVSLSELTTIRDLGDKVGWDRLQQIIDLLRPD